MVEDGEEVEADAPPWWARVVVGGVLVLIAIAFVVPVKFTFWPITSWELFSRLRDPEQVGWEVRSVASDGTEAAIPFTQIGPGHTRWLLVARRLPQRSEAERVAVCESWADAAEATLGPDEVAEVRVYRVVRRAADRLEDPPVTVDEELYVDCEPET